jgi:thioredoxin reductase
MQQKGINQAEKQVFCLKPQNHNILYYTTPGGIPQVVFDEKSKKEKFSLSTESGKLHTDKSLYYATESDSRRLNFPEYFFFRRTGTNRSRSSPACAGIRK